MEPHDQDRPGDPPVDATLDELIAAVFDAARGDASADRASARATDGVDQVFADADEEPVVTRLQDIASALRTVEPSEQVDLHVTAALEVWDALQADASSVAGDTVPDQLVPDQLVPDRVVPMVGRPARSNRRRAFAVPPAWLGAAAASILVIGAAVVVLDRGPSGGSDQAVPAALEADDDDDAGMALFAADDHDDAARSVAEPEDTSGGAPEAMIAADAAEDAADGEVADAVIPFIGEVDPTMIDLVVADLLPGSEAGGGAPCAGVLDVVVAEGVLGRRPVLVGTSGADAVAVDLRDCELVASQPLPERSGP